ncbi:MAG: hypothetical protein ACK4MH_00980 [Brevundimonas sp.]|uniref:hypothetical protein n=1 Tax=Brevundimonas sp. TaxID=1871086 RepID=UPI00391CA211
MKSIRSNMVRLSAAVAMTMAATFVSTGTASANPGDPVCIMPPDDYCTLLGGYTFGTSAWRDCYRRASELYYGEYCNGTES